MEKLKGSIEATINLGNYESLRPGIQFEVDDSPEGHQEALEKFAKFSSFLIKKWQEEKPANMIHFINRVKLSSGLKIDEAKVSHLFKSHTGTTKKTDNAL